MLKVVVLSVVVGLMFGCQSKFTEKSPTSNGTGEVPMQERLQQKAAIDKQIEEIESTVVKVKRLISRIKDVRSASENEDLYTPVDFFLDSIRELKSSIPEGTRSNLIRKGRIKLPFEELSQDCRTIDTILATSEVNEKAPSSQLTFSVRTCGTRGAYLPVFAGSVKGKNIEIILNTANLQQILNRGFVPGIQQPMSCRVEQDSAGILDAISCANLQFPLSKIEIAHFEQANFNNSGGASLYVRGYILKNDKVSAKGELIIDKNGVSGDLLVNRAPNPEQPRD